MVKSSLILIVAVTGLAWPAHARDSVLLDSSTVLQESKPARTWLCAFRDLVLGRRAAPRALVVEPVAKPETDAKAPSFEPPPPAWIRSAHTALEKQVFPGSKVEQTYGGSFSISFNVRTADGRELNVKMPRNAQRATEMGVAYDREREILEHLHTELPEFRTSFVPVEPPVSVSAGEAGVLPGFVTQRANRGDLAHNLVAFGDKVPAKAQLEMWSTLARALTGAQFHRHPKMLFHGDVKPSNILVHEIDGKLQLWLADWGSTYIEGVDSGVTSGSFDYFARASLDGPIDPVKNDARALKMVLLQMATGRQLKQILKDYPDSVETVPVEKAPLGSVLYLKELPPDLAAVLPAPLREVLERDYDDVQALYVAIEAASRRHPN